MSQPDFEIFTTVVVSINRMLHECKQRKIQKSIILESRLKVATFFPKSTCNRLFFRTKSIIQKVLVQATGGWPWLEGFKLLKGSIN
jgi:hypothetical protein